MHFAMGCICCCCICRCCFCNGSAFYQLSLLYYSKCSGLEIRSLIPVLPQRVRFRNHDPVLPQRVRVINHESVLPQGVRVRGRFSSGCNLRVCAGILLACAHRGANADVGKWWYCCAIFILTDTPNVAIPGHWEYDFVKSHALTFRCIRPSWLCLGVPTIN